MREPTFRRPQSLYETVRTIYFHHFSWSHKCILCKHYTTFELSLIYSTLYMAFPRQPLLFTETVPHNSYETVEGNLSLCFSGRSEKQDGRPGLSLAETFSTSPLKPLNGIQRNSTGSKILMSSTKFVFFGPIGKTRWPPWPLIGWDIFDFFSETAERNSRNLTGSKISTSSTKFVFFGPIGKTRWPPWPLIGWDIFDFFSETAERNSRNLTGSKISTSSTKFVFFGPIGKTRWPPWPLIGWDIFDFFSETAERNSMKLDRKQDLNVFY